MNLLFGRQSPGRWRAELRGVVQGVGFRPFVHRLAQELHLAGFVGNSSAGVFLEVEGDTPALLDFARRLEAEPPVLAVIDHCEWHEVPATSEPGFAILASRDERDQRTPVAPDAATCADCLREMFDPTDRRYLYPFLNCTNCGPRYTIVRGVPYDRPLTAMAEFPLCVTCSAEYHDPQDRRFHAQPTACWTCGPRLSLPVEEILAALEQGKIVALQGLGGFHLACLAEDARAVARLRERKGRGDQPFALMVRDVEAARQVAQVDEQAARLLASAAAPIVLLPKRPGPQRPGQEAIGDAVAPHNGYLGVMLPYTPLHHLLFRHPQSQGRPLVMTSGNRSGEPICRTPEEAAMRLAPIADLIVTHNRPIEAVADDSLVRLHAGRPLAIRRSRGYAPLPVRLAQPAGELLATGAELKAVLGLAAGDRAYLSPHIGDMENLETLAAFERTYAHLRRILRVDPVAIVCDAHPDYLSSQWAARTAQEKGLALYRVQHHRAHAASVLAEYGVGPEHRVTAVIYDGTGYGDDAAIWGGEVFVGPVHSLARVRHLPYVDLPGGDAAARRPVHCALAYLWQAGLDWEGPLPAGERRLLARQWERRLNCFPTSSMGRLFDGVAGYLGICREARYEAQAAIEMEAIAAAWTEKGEEAPPFEGPPWDLRSLWHALRAAREQPPCLAARFHRTIAEWTSSACQEAGEETVALSGGVWQNVLLLRQTQGLLEHAGFRVLTPRLIPPNDAGLALGQLVLAAGIRSTPLDTPAPPLPS